MSASAGSLLPAVGTTAPTFMLLDSDGHSVSLEEFRGKRVLLYFYPKDDTPGCTTEACSFRDNFAAIEKLGVVVLGLSKDSPKSHRKFADKFNLPFTLLSDDTGAVCESYGVWVEKSMYGKKYMGIARTTFLIAPNGTIEHIWENVKPSGHVQEVLEYLGG